SILRTCTDLDIERLVAHQLLAVALELIDVVGMAHRSKEVGCAKLFEGAAVVVERGAIRVEPPARRVEDDDVLRNGIDEIAQLLLLPCEHLLAPLAIVDVGPRDVPGDGTCAVVPKRGATHEEPAV